MPKDQSFSRHQISWLIWALNQNLISISIMMTSDVTVSGWIRKRTCLPGRKVRTKGILSPAEELIMFALPCSLILEVPDLYLFCNSDEKQAWLYLFPISVFHGGINQLCLIYSVPSVPEWPGPFLDSTLNKKGIIISGVEPKSLQFNQPHRHNKQSVNQS